MKLPSLQEVTAPLRKWLARNQSNGNGSVRTTERFDEVEQLRREIEVLRNEIQENVAAIHRLEILTLNQRLALLQSFGKALTPTSPGRTRDSVKPPGYSFGIITNGLRARKLATLLESIQAQPMAENQYEILIAGRVSEITGRQDVRLFPMEASAGQGRLGALRNRLAHAATFNKFVSLDDDFILHPTWLSAVNEVNDDFDLATGTIVNPDLSRYCDWVNLIGNYSFLRCYHEAFDSCQYITGGFGIYKDYLFHDHQWDEDLGFYQGEDVRLSKRLFEAGYQLKFIPKAIVMHDDERYRQKGYGVIRQPTSQSPDDPSALSMRVSQLCPRTLT